MLRLEGERERRREGDEVRTCTREEECLHIERLYYGSVLRERTFIRDTALYLSYAMVRLEMHKWRRVAMCAPSKAATHNHQQPEVNYLPRFSPPVTSLER